MSKPFVKDTIGHFRNLILHALREYEPSSPHILKRLILPLCRDFKRIVEKGTTKDTKEVLESFLAICQKYLSRYLE